MLQELTVKGFVEELGSDSPAPGGGSVAALSASLASSLVGMVFGLTIGKKAYNEYEKSLQENIDEALSEAVKCKKEFLDLMEKDTEAFLSLMDAFKMPKNTEEEIAKRKEKIQQGNKATLEIPLSVAERAYKLYDYVYLAAEYGNKNALSDTGVAASLVETAVEGALLNVKINTMSLKDETRKQELNDKCSALLEKRKMKKEDIMSSIVNQLK